MLNSLYRPALCAALLLLSACATAPPPVPAVAAVIAAPACPDHLSPDESFALGRRHQKLIAALASGQRDVARAFYDERAIIAGPGIVGPFESILANKVDNPQGVFLSLPPQVGA